MGSLTKESQTCNTRPEVSADFFKFKQKLGRLSKVILSGIIWKKLNIQQKHNATAELLHKDERDLYCESPINFM